MILICKHYSEVIDFFVLDRFDTLQYYDSIIFSFSYYFTLIFYLQSLGQSKVMIYALREIKFAWNRILSHENIS